MMTQESRPKLLFISHVLPYPQDSGARIRTFNVLRLLSNAFDVTALCFYRRAGRSGQMSVDQAVEMLAPLARATAFTLPQENSLLRWSWDHVRSVALRKPYTYFTYGDVRFARALRQVLASNLFDLVHVDSLDLARYMNLFAAPVVCSHHNIESDLLRRRASIQKGMLSRHYLTMQAELVESVERRWCGSVALNVVVSEADANRLKRIVPEAQVAIVPNGVDARNLRPEPNETEGLVFVGAYDWAPNRDAMKFFCDRVLPIIRRARPDLPMAWVGRAPDSVRADYSRKYGIELTGYVDDVRPFVRRAACYVVPLRAGGGSRLKILEAWALGKAVVSTAVGCQGLQAVDGENVLVRDTPEAFASGVLTVLDSPQIRQRLESSGRRTAESVYDWERIGEPMVRRYLSVVGQPTS